MKKLFALLLTVLFLTATGVVMADTTTPAPTVKKHHKGHKGHKKSTTAPAATDSAASTTK
jgi:hypothetical protein